MTNFIDKIQPIMQNIKQNPQGLLSVEYYNVFNILFLG